MGSILHSVRTGEGFAAGGEDLSTPAASTNERNGEEAAMSEVGPIGDSHTRSTKHFEPRLIEIAWFTQQAPETLEASLRWACLFDVRRSQYGVFSTTWGRTRRAASCLAVSI